VTAVELNDALATICTDACVCYAEKLSPSSGSVRVDPTGRRTGVFSIFLGQTGKNLAKRAEPPATFKDRGFFLPFSKVSDHVLELVEKGDKFNIEYYQGVAIAWVPPDYFVVLLGPAYVSVRDAIKRAREWEDIVKNILKPGPQ
jgi:hypothetical protein